MDKAKPSQTRARTWPVRRGSQRKRHSIRATCMVPLAYHHNWAIGVAEQVSEPLLTCEAVLAEAAFHLHSVSAVLAMVRDGLVLPAFDCTAHLVQLQTLATRYADRDPDFADLCLIRMSELHPKHPVITVDRRDFRI